MIAQKETKTELTCMSVSPSQRLVAVGGRSLLKLYSLRNDIEGDSVFAPPSPREGDNANSIFEPNRDVLPKRSISNHGLPSPTSSSTGAGVIDFDLRYEKQLSDKTTTDLAMNPSMENVLANGSARRVVELWDLVACSSRKLVTLDHASITKLSWQVSEPNTLLIGATDGLLRVADVRSQDPVHTIMAPKSREIRDCQFNPHDNCTLAACFDNGTVQTFDCRQPKQCARRMIVHDGGALCLAYHPTRRGILATGGASSGLALAQSQQAFKLKIIAPDREAFLVKSVRVQGVSALCWRRNTNEIATSLDSKFDHDLFLWNYEDPFYLPLARLGGHSNQVTRITFLSSSPTSGEDDHLLSVGKDGRLILQKHRHMFLPKKGNAFCFSSFSSLMVSDDPVLPDKAQKRGKAVAHEYSFAKPSPSVQNEDAAFLALSKLYRIGPFADIHEACDTNAEACVKAGNALAAGFWRTLDCWLTDDEEERKSVTANDDKDDVVPSEQALPQSANSPKLVKTTSIEQLHDEQGGTRSLLKQLGAIDPSVSKIFQVRTRLASFRQLVVDLNATVGEKATLETKLDEPHVAVIPVVGKQREDDDDATGQIKRPKQEDCIASVKQALTSLVDQHGDVQTAVVCVLVFSQLGLPLPATLPALRRWSWALCDLLEQKLLFPEALEFAQETSRLLKGKEEDPESRIGMACGTCEEPLPSLGAHGECPACKTVVAKCAICRRVVKGMYATCLKCGHGGHLDHMQEWFGAGNVECPLGCQCQCKLQD